MLSKNTVSDLSISNEETPDSITKEGNKAYANAAIKLFSKLNEGELSAQREGWVDGKDVRGILTNK